MIASAAAITVTATVHHRDSVMVCFWVVFLLMNAPRRSLMRFATTDCSADPVVETIVAMRNAP